MADLENLWLNTFKYLDGLGEDITDDILKLLRNKNKFATGELYNSINYDIDVNGNKIGLVIEYAEQGEFVISGRKPNSKLPPISSIKEWILNKRIKSSDLSLDSQAYLIARSIAKKGIPPLDFLSSYNYMVKSKKYLDELEKVIAMDITRQLELGLEQ